MTLTVTAICDLYAFLYTDLPIPPGTWDHVLPTDGCYTAIKNIDGTDYVMFRGSVTFLDWIEDFQLMAVPFEDEILGPVHPGAREAILAMMPQIDALLGPSVVIVGHSLGAMHAALLAGYRVAARLPVDALIMFGEPRSGGPKLSEILANTPVQSFRNERPAKPAGTPIAHDLVTEFQRALPPDMPYQHVRDPLTPCYHEPRINDLWLLFKWHHFGHYCHAFGCGGVAALSLPT